MQAFRTRTGKGGPRAQRRIHSMGLIARAFRRRVANHQGHERRDGESLPQSGFRREHGSMGAGARGKKAEVTAL